ncbi:MAG: glycine--tRNA ligase subunit beta [Sphingobium sp.]|nr:glycine--tRNA ligase subunit beta [Sphingobium sp.]MBP6112514.1 glycine--tRNA ligase subunit beta [Sphingobium sp.]MBP8669943.1 glycine--tRNA ligase subunit beta [Sphingobium sp.]MBP9157874.1 glycine--tRNA ligase subunit beta [Sphingobium sp.]MCC6480967.1 glycine--tRNA ligase subunit beta [Sphingomonadaceae bacterium]
MSADFLLELRCEEIPARMQDAARADLARLFAAELTKAGLKAAAITTYATPRRLALIAHGLPVQTEAVAEEFKGPRTSAPEQALDGFLRKTGLTKDQLQDRDGVWFASVEKPGRATADVLAEAIPAIIRAFPWPKSMRWGDASASTESLRWVRPLQGIVALLGEDLVPVEIGGIAAGYATLGHRFHHPGVITIGGAADYVEKLRACHVIVDQDERKAIIAAQAAKLAGEAGYSLIEDAGLVAENAGLTEWPVPLLGQFDPGFLEVPPEVIQLTLRINQKYFVLRSADGKLAPAFICTANIDAKDGGAAIVAGNGKVLAARLSDARFFWSQDKKTPLADHAKKLSRITFHEKLGTVADKVERVAKLAEWLASEGIVPNCDPALARQAAELCKADLVTEMVGEFPELQGLMGGYYARAEGLPDAVADAIRDHYKPVGQGDDVPTAPVTVAVSLADNFDTVFSFFAINERPTGSKDPFALRRSSLKYLSILIKSNISLKAREFDSYYGCLSDKIEDLLNLKREALEHEKEKRRSLWRDSSTHGVESEDEAHREWNSYRFNLDRESATLETDISRIHSSIFVDRSCYHAVLDFFADRLKVQQKEAGVRPDLIEAVFSLGGEDDLVRLLARVRALQGFIETPDGANLLAGYKRAANILKKEGVETQNVIPAEAGSQTPPVELDSRVRGNDDLEYPPEPAEAALLAALDTAEPRATAAIEAEDFEGAMSALASLRAPIDAFFESVIVNDPDPAKRAARLALLQRVRAAVHKVADFSRIGG